MFNYIELFYNRKLSGMAAGGKFAVRLAVRLDSPLRVKWKPPIAQSRAWHYSNALL
jgi:hypothetical protein